MKFEISRSIYPDGKIRFIARDKDRIVRFREDTLEDIQKAIKTYKEPPPVKEEEETPVEPASAEASEPKKKFLTNKLAEKVQKRKQEQETPETAASAKKKSFWDRLK